MIEAAMLVALGFCAATLLALLALPLVSRRAARLAALRLQDVLPLSYEEIAADRDGVRAVAAVEQRRLEQKLERAQATAATAEIAVGRVTTALTHIERARESDLAERLALAAEGERLAGALASAQAQLGEALRAGTELQARLADEQQQREAAELQRDKFEALAEERRGAVASLETRNAGLDAVLADRIEEIERARVEQARLRGVLTDTVRERDRERHELLRASAQHAILQDDVRRLTGRAEDLRARLTAGAENLGRAERLLMEEAAARRASEDALTALRRRFEALEARLIEAGGLAAETLVESEIDALRAAVSTTADEALDVLAGSRRTRDE